jgi:ribosome-interacting GTPase 1
MPTNLPPQIADLEKKYLQAETISEKIKALEEYLSAIPKHKGTEKLRMQIKTKLSKLRLTFEEQKKRRSATSTAGGRYAIKREGAAQVVIIGVANSGRSSLLSALTNAEPNITSYPFGTTKPIPGMMLFEDVQIQLLEGPALFKGAADGKGWGPKVLSLARNADGLILLIDLSYSDPISQVKMLVNELYEAHIVIEEPSSQVEVIRKASGGIQVVNYGTFSGSLDQIRKFLYSNGITDAVVKLWGNTDLDAVSLALVTSVVHKPAVIVANKLDIKGGSEKLKELKNYFSDKIKVIGISCKTGEKLETLPKKLFNMLKIVRIYTKRSGKEATEKPLIFYGDPMVEDVAKEVHSEFIKQFKFARIWGSSNYPGERVGLNYELQDRDVIEIRTS